MSKSTLRYKIQIKKRLDWKYHINQADYGEIYIQNKTLSQLNLS